MSTPGEMPRPAGRGRGPIIAVGIAALALVVLLIPGVLLSVGDGATTPRASEAERQLERQIKEFERQLGGDVCRAEPQTPTLRPPGSTPPGEEGGKSGTGRPPYTIPVVPDRVPVPDGVAPGRPTRPSSLADLLDRATVLVMTSDGTGSGFFIAPNLVMTNAHVVEGSGPVIRIGNKWMPRLIEVQVVARLGPGQQLGDPDYALLKLPSDQTLGHLTFVESPPAKLQNVVAAGYPAFITRIDPQYRKLDQGDLTAIPESSLSQGAVMVVQGTDGPGPMIVHRASISGGNSGGPLTDECGRVVGVNTAGRAAEGKQDRQHFAQASKSALAFLKQNGVTPQVVAGECVIAQGPAGSTPAPQPGAGSAPPKQEAGPTPPPAPGGPTKPGGEKGK